MSLSYRSFCRSVEIRVRKLFCVYVRAISIPKNESRYEHKYFVDLIFFLVDAENNCIEYVKKILVSYFYVRYAAVIF